MKSKLILIITACAFLFPGHAKAQFSALEREASKIMARNILLGFVGLGDNFASYKGGFEKKDEDGISYYALKDLVLGGTTQNVIINPKGAFMIFATYKKSHKDDPTPRLMLDAFTNGIIAIKKDADIVIEKDDSQLNDGIQTYFLKIEGRRYACLYYVAEDDTATLIIGVL